MKVILKDKNHYILRFDRGEEVTEGLKNFCQEEKIAAGYFSGLGAVSEITLSYFNYSTKKYEDKNIKDDLEAVSFTGNVSIIDGDVIIHAHGAFGDSKLAVLGGHVKKMAVLVTAEIHLQAFEGKIERILDERTGLNLME